MLAFSILIACLAVIVIGVEAVSRRWHVPLEVTRKATHILTGVAVAASAPSVTQPYRIVLAVLFVIVIAFSRRLGVFRSIHEAGRQGLGELWYPIGILLTAACFASADAFAYGVLILAVADGLAGLLGKLFGKRRIGLIATQKTYLGSGVFLVTAFALSLAFVPLPVACVAAMYLTAVELLSSRGLDNLVLPLIAGAIAVTF